MATHKYILVNREIVECDDLLQWARWFEMAERKVAVTMVGSVKISTVFLGLNHRFNGAGPPILFETQVFGGADDGEQERYTTWDEAVLGHSAMIDRVVGSKTEKGATDSP